MCTNKHWITNKLGKELFVKCGHCPACLQEKALARTQRIRNNSQAGQRVLFVTLTYDNEHIPYFRPSELRSMSIVQTDPLEEVDYKFYGLLPIHRDKTTRFVRSGKNYKQKAISVPNENPIYFTRIPVPTKVLNNQMDAFDKNSLDRLFRLKFKELREFYAPNKWRYINDKVGICYYKDLQDFIKRLRINLKRNYNIDESFSYYSCSEYGPSSCRPHFHLLLFLPSSGSVKDWKSAIIKSWPYADNRRTKRYIQIARNAASYVSSYVNCDASVPSFFKDIDEFKTKHSYSQGFGMAPKHYSLEEVLKSINRGDMREDCKTNRDGAVIVTRRVLPKYVISRYFPKFKRYNSFTSDEIKQIVCRPSTLRHFSASQQLDWYDDIPSIIKRIEHKVQYAESLGISRETYAKAYSRVWSVYSSNVLRDFYDSFDNPLQFLFAYDNINNLYSSGGTASPALYDIALHASSEWFCDDPNDFPPNRASTARLEEIYRRTSKDKKIRNHIYSQNHLM